MVISSLVRPDVNNRPPIFLLFRFPLEQASPISLHLPIPSNQGVCIIVCKESVTQSLSGTFWPGLSKPQGCSPRAKPERLGVIDQGGNNNYTELSRVPLLVNTALATEGATLI